MLHHRAAGHIGAEIVWMQVQLAEPFHCGHCVGAGNLDSHQRIRLVGRITRSFQPFPDMMFCIRRGMRAVNTAPDKMLLVFAHTTPDAEHHVRTGLRGTGYTTDQTDSLVAIEIFGPDTMAAMERLCPLDLHPENFGTDMAGRTVMEHMAATIICLADAHFLLLTASSSGISFLHAIETSYRNVIGAA